LERTQRDAAEVLSEAMGLNVPQDADATKQRQILDALPVLVFL